MQRHSPKLIRVSPEIRAFIKSYETLELAAYDDGAGVQTIGWGHTDRVQEGMKITRTQAEDYFRADLGVAEGSVRLFVKVPLAQHEYDALVSFIFNVGGGGFGKSTMRALLNELRYEDAADQFSRWVYANGKPMRGLKRRREAEKLIFERGVYRMNK